MRRQYRITVDLFAMGSLHIAGPGRRVPLVDRALAVDAEGVPVLPASSVRGRVRAHLERLLHALDQPVCSPPNPEGMCPHAGAVAQRLKPAEPFCLACRLFGSPWRQAAVAFDDFRLVGEQRNGLELPRRTGVSVNRRLGTVQEGRLFTQETTPPEFDGAPLHFVGCATGLLHPDEVGWLLAAMRLLAHVGGNKARGLGRVRLEPKVECWDSQSGQWHTEAGDTFLGQVIPDGTQA